MSRAKGIILEQQKILEKQLIQADGQIALLNANLVSYQDHVLELHNVLENKKQTSNLSRKENSIIESKLLEAVNKIKQVSIEKNDVVAHKQTIADILKLVQIKYEGSRNGKNGNEDNADCFNCGTKGHYARNCPHPFRGTERNRLSGK